MIDAKVTLKLDSKQVLDKAKKGEATSLKHAGAIIRKAAQDSLTSGDGPSKPGTPPHSQSGKLKKSILFDLDEKGESVVIGPAKRSSAFYGHMHEFGGVYTVGAVKRGRKTNSRNGQKMTFPKRPYMAPALEHNLDRLPSCFKNLLSKGE